MQTRQSVFVQAVEDLKEVGEVFINQLHSGPGTDILAGGCIVYHFGIRWKDNPSKLYNITYGPTNGKYTLWAN